MNKSIFIYKSNLKISASLLFNIENEKYQINLSFTDSDTMYELVGTANNYFHALLNVREQLDVKGYLIGVQGCRRDFYPSPMALDMAKGKVGYILSIGEHSNEKARTFDVVESPDLLSTVKDQTSYYLHWKESIQ